MKLQHRIVERGGTKSRPIFYILSTGKYMVLWMNWKFCVAQFWVLNVKKNFWINWPYLESWFRLRRWLSVGDSQVVIYRHLRLHSFFLVDIIHMYVKSLSTSWSYLVYFAEIVVVVILNMKGNGGLCFPSLTVNSEKLVCFCDDFDLSCSWKKQIKFFK